jgi:hypothetical protein
MRGLPPRVELDGDETAGRGTSNGLVNVVLIMVMLLSM